MLRGIIFWVMVGLAVPISILWPFQGLLIYMGFAHSRIVGYVWRDYTFFYGMVIGGALLVGYCVFELRRSPPRWRGMWVLLVFWAWLALAATLAYDPALAYPKLWEYSRVFVATLLVSAMANSEVRVRQLLYVIGGSLGVLGLKGAWDANWTNFQYQMMGPGGHLADENDFALALNMAIPILFWLGRSERRRWMKLGMWAMAAGCGVTVVGTRSRSGMLGLLLGALLITLYSERKVLAALLLAVGLAVFPFVAPRAAIERYKSIPTASTEDASAIGRVQAWQTAMAMAKAHPFFGVGLRNFVPTFNLFTQFESLAPHNGFMALIAESGIPSCVLFVLLVVGSIGKMFRLRRKLRGRPENANLATYCLILQGTLTVYLVPNLFINRQDLDLMFHLVGLTAGLAWTAKQRLAEQQKAEAAVPAPVPELAIAN